MSFNRLTAAEAERLAILSEELGETVHIIGKILRHGYENHSPANPKTTNRALLERELGHVRFMMDAMCNNRDVSYGRILKAKTDKCLMINDYLHEQDGTDWYHGREKRGLDRWS